MRGRFLWFVVALLTLLSSVVVARLGSRLASSPVLEAQDSLGALLMLNTRAVLWGPGFVAVVLSCLRAWPRDRDDGVFELARVAGFDARRWIAARTLVLGLWLLVLWFASTLLVVGMVGGGLLSGLVPAGVFALVQCALLALLGSVCLGPRSRPGGYALLAMILFVPETFAAWTEPLLGRDFTSLPALAKGLALAAQPAAFDALRAGRCGIALLGVLVALALWLRQSSKVPT